MYIKLFESFNERDIHEICKKHYICNYTINEDGSIDVNDDVNLMDCYLDDFPIKFRNVSGYFYCGNNNLTSLKGCPKTVGGDFSCSVNNLSSLKGCPKSVGGSFACSYNRLLSLKGMPEKISGDFYCVSNRISTFEYFPKHINGYFNCASNPIWEIWKLFKDYSKIDLFNDMDIIQDDAIILDRLNFFLEEIGRHPVKSVHKYKYI